MSEAFLTVLTAAFVAQILVLPGEKVQFIIAGLSTRYNPLLVVAAAGSAFAGWTALEILFGEALKRVVPAVYLDVFTAGLFVLFAVMLIRSAPAPGESVADVGESTAKTSEGVPVSTETDGGVASPADDDAVGSGAPDVSILGWSVPDRLGGFLPIFALMAAGEFGDKTQLVTFGLAAQYGAHPGIWAGEMLAIIPVSLANAYFFHRYAHRVSLRKAHYAGGAIFLFFGVDTALSILTGFSVWETAVSTVSEAVLALI
jgi:putative Ca2+/H+ antiporter (TMEM165/GDT1 family)